ncbi:hypothetical protein [Pontivivens insulae]|uniref:Uncharacterized protein n=1 Tax=Pontivivens insulae TaxID=1639689 RepID=A0A2R8A9M8_9RHOB|nr:hypothetical protein [Pontivivens insulae]RED12825.1 hypothetical protein DFR53_1956 [Pontivivens insulae]SPF28916.1 hypothetical protein POI8812_01219 [Pontivivens insulae]
MFRRLGLIAVFLAPLRAQAEPCPDFYRFVDFGLPDAEGALHRGGPVVRAEGFAGETLLEAAATECVTVSPLSRDGHGNPMPVVSRIGFRVARLDSVFDSLSVFVAQDSLRFAQEAAMPHRAAVAGHDAAIFRGADILCVDQTNGLSCQIASPFDAAGPVVAYCEASACHLPAMALNDRILVEARWPATDEGVEALAEMIRAQDQAIDAFLTPISSGL